MLTYRVRGEGAIPRREYQVCSSKGHRELRRSVRKQLNDKKGAVVASCAPGTGACDNTVRNRHKETPHDVTNSSSGALFVPGVGFEPT